MDAVWERLGVNAECSDLNGPHRRLREGCEPLGYDFRLITRNADPDLYDPITRRLHGLRRPVRLEALDREDLPRRRPGRRGRVLRRLPASSGSSSRTAAPPASRPSRSTRRPGSQRRRRSDPDRAGADVVVAAGSIESPALLLRSRIGGPAVGDYLRLHPTVAVTAYYEEPQNWMWGPPQAALSHEFADIERRLRLPDRVRPGDHRAVRRRAAVAFGRRPQAADARVGPRGAASSASPAIAATAGSRSTPPATRSSTTRSPTSSTSPTCSGGRRAGRGPRGGRGARDRRQRPRAPDWRRGDDLEAFIAALNELAIVPRENGLFSAHQMGSCRMGADPQTSVAGPWGELHDTPGSGSATRAPSRARPGRTRCSRSWRSPGAPRTRSLGRGSESAKLTVAVTGPTGDIGRAAVRALESGRRSGGSSAWRGGRSTRPSTAGSARSTAGATSSTAPRSTRSSPTPTSSSTSPSSSSATTTRPTGSTSRARATSSRRPRPPARSGSSTPRRSPPTASTTATAAAHRGRARAGTEGFYYSAHKAELELVLATARRLGDRRLRLPALHRRRRRRADAGRDAHDGQPAQRRARAAAQGARAAAARRPVLPDPGVQFQLVHTTTSRRRSPRRLAARASPASTTSPPRTRSPSPTSPASSAGRRCRSPRRRSRRLPRRSTGPR